MMNTRLLWYTAILCVVVAQVAAFTMSPYTIYTGTAKYINNVPTTIDTADFTVAGWVSFYAYSQAPTYKHPSIIWEKGYTSLLILQVNVDGTLTFFMGYQNYTFSLQSTVSVPLNTLTFVGVRRSDTLACLTIGNDTVCNDTGTVFDSTSSYDMCLGSPGEIYNSDQYCSLDGYAEMAYYDSYLANEDLQLLGAPAPEFAQYLVPGEVTSIPDVPIIGTSDFSIAGWLHVNAYYITSNQSIWSKDMQDTDEVTYKQKYYRDQPMLDLKLNTNSKLVLTIDRQLTSSRSISYYTWTFVAVRRTGNVFRLMVDTKEDVFELDNVYDHSSNFGLRVGSTSLMSEDHFGSQFLDGWTVMAFYDRYLSDTELAIMKATYTPQALSLPTPNIPYVPHYKATTTTTLIGTTSGDEPQPSQSKFSAYCGRGCFLAIVITFGFTFMGLIALAFAYFHARKRLAQLRYKEQQGKTESLPGVSVA